MAIKLLMLLAYVAITQCTWVKEMESKYTCFSDK